jgi:hypothetical protein
MCEDSEQIPLDCGGCGPHWGDQKACAARCNGDVTCKFFTYFHDDGCRIYRKCDAQHQTDWLPKVHSTIFERLPKFLSTTYIEKSVGDWGEVHCDAGMRVVGGGCQAYERPHVMQASRPTDDGAGWLCGGHGGPKKVMALCARIPTKVEVTSGGDWHQTGCPANSVAIGGGCDANNNPYIMEYNGIEDDGLTKQQCGGHGGPKAAWAICAFDDGNYQKVTTEGGDWHDTQCPAGTVVVSGGCQAHGSPHKYEYNGPFGNGWKCGGHGGPKKVWAVCHKN